MTLYNCRHDGDQYRISKFDDSLNVESSYLCTVAECECPAGVRPMCRHREMLPRFISRQAVGTGWMFDYDRGGWVDNRTQEEIEAIHAVPLPLLPKGVEVFSLDDPADLHEAIANAVGESPAPAPQPPVWKRPKDGRRV